MSRNANIVEIVCAISPVEVEQVRGLLVEYAQSLGFSLCFQAFDKELAELPGVYAKPEGRLLLGTVDGEPVGCAGLRKLGHGIGEMKRLYVRPQFRGLGLGRRLAGRIIFEARTIGYQRVPLTPSLARWMSLFSYTANSDLSRSLRIERIPCRGHCIWSLPCEGRLNSPAELLRVGLFVCLH